MRRTYSTASANLYLLDGQQSSVRRIPTPPLLESHPTVTGKCGVNKVRRGIPPIIMIYDRLSSIVISVSREENLILNLHDLVLDGVMNKMNERLGP
jgi:hypothetical protein